MKKVIESLAEGIKSNKENKSTSVINDNKKEKINKKKIMCYECKRLTAKNSSYNTSNRIERNDVDQYWMRNFLSMPNKHGLFSNELSKEVNLKETVRNPKNSLEIDKSHDSHDSHVSHQHIKCFISNESDLIKNKYDYVLNKFN